VKWIIRLYALVLLGYTGWRTYDFMINQLPAGDTSTLLALLFLFATEAGLALWHEISLRHSTTSEQQMTATALTWVDFAGSLTAGVADMILRQNFASGYTIPPLLVLLLLYGLPLIVALNVAGVLIYLSHDAEAQLDRAKSQLRFEITRQALRELHDNRGAIAEGMKKDIYRQLRDDVTGKVAKQFLKAPKIVEIASKNGRESAAVYNADTEGVTTDPPKGGRK
jgi:uncharacterized membrane protein